MNKELTIGGYTLEELKKIQAAVQKEASKVISEAVAAAEAAVQAIVETAQNYEEDVEQMPDSLIRELAQTAEDNLALAKLVSGLSGVEYCISWDEEYREQDDTMSTLIEGAFDGDYPDVLSGVMSYLEDMEHQSYLWNSSSIGC